MSLNPITGYATESAMHGQYDTRPMYRLPTVSSPSTSYMVGDGTVQM